MWTDTLSSYTNSKSFKITTLTNCNTMHVVYLACCNEGRLQYVGCTTRKDEIRLGEHITANKSTTNFNCSLSGISWHFRLSHGGDLTNLSFTIIERVNQPPRGGNWQRLVLMREALWIHRLDTCSPVGLNVKTDLTYLYWWAWFYLPCPYKRVLYSSLMRLFQT